MRGGCRKPPDNFKHCICAVIFSTKGGTCHSCNLCIFLTSYLISCLEMSLKWNLITYRIATPFQVLRAWVAGNFPRCRTDTPILCPAELSASQALRTWAKTVISIIKNIFCFCKNLKVKLIAFSLSEFYILLN